MPEDSASKAVSERIEDANRRGADILTKAQPTWVDVMPARDFIPGFKENLVLFAGPPLDPRNALKPVRTAIAAAAVQERLAKTVEEAWEKVLRGEIILGAMLDNQAAGGGFSPITASTPVLVVEDTLTGSRGCCTIYEGSEGRSCSVGASTRRRSPSGSRGSRKSSDRSSGRWFGPWAA